jgi:transposase
MTRGGWGSKLHLVVDRGGLPIAFTLTKGNRNECPEFAGLLDAAIANRGGESPQSLAADKGYSSDALRRDLVGRGIRPVIPMRHNEHVDDHDAPELGGPFDREAYRGRNVVERCVGKLKEMRRIATRYEKLAGNFAAMITLAMAVLYFRILT